MKRTWRNILFSAWDIAWMALDRRMSTWRSRFSLRFQGCPYGKRFRTNGPCFFKARREGSIRIGNFVSLAAGWRHNRAGLTNPIRLQTLGDGEITIGDHSGCSGVILSSRSAIHIGNHVRIGANVRIFDHDFHSLDPYIRQNPKQDQENCKSAPIIIEDNVLIGTNSIILKGVTIGSKAIIGAGSVVTLKQIPAGAVVAGNPAKIVRQQNRVP